MLADIRDADDRGHTVIAIKAFAAAYVAKYPMAVAKIVDDRETLLAFFDFPAERWIHLKTTARSSSPSSGPAPSSRRGDGGAPQPAGSGSRRVTRRQS